MSRTPSQFSAPHAQACDLAQAGEAASSPAWLRLQERRHSRQPRWLGRASALVASALLCAVMTIAVADDNSNQPDTGSGQASASKTPPPSVVVAAVQKQDVAAERRYIGTIKAIQSVDVRARVEGFLEQVAFEQGRTVEKQQRLYQIEQAQYQAALANAEGQLAAAEAGLASAQATLADKQADFKRFETLVKKGDTSQTTFDRAKAQRDEAAANVETAKANIKQAQAAMQSAHINLSYTTISSPIAGRIGATNYTEGNLVDPSSGTLATVVQLDPIRAVFSIPSADFVRIQQRVADDGADHARDLFVPHLILPTGETYAHQGEVSFADNRVNPATGTIPIYADFPNPDRLLLPGQFVTALVRTAETQQAPVVPAAAILRTREGEQVYLVGKDNRVEQRTIKTGIQVGTGYAVTSGLQSGEIVIVSGVQKVKPGMEVTPVKQSEAAPMGRALSIDSANASSSSKAASSSASKAGRAAAGGRSETASDPSSDAASDGSKTDSDTGGSAATANGADHSQ